jgi:hypothetical protein
MEELYTNYTMAVYDMEDMVPLVKTLGSAIQTMNTAGLRKATEAKRSHTAFAIMDTEMEYVCILMTDIMYNLHI